MKDVLKSKGMIAFALFIISLSVINVFKINAQKNVSAVNTNNSNYLEK
jgi:hypothetical protein